ncbi:MAG: hypothetical protein IPM46_00230 [Flavobacteriales bacterium]|nr:hypothetical protein [Flavobacteriales bacterium]
MPICSGWGSSSCSTRRGSIVALDPKTGEVLCLVSSPAYDPELLVGRVRNANYAALQHDSIKPLFDRALQAQYPPGSIFKIVQSLIALDEGDLREQQLPVQQEPGGLPQPSHGLLTSSRPSSSPATLLLRRLRPHRRAQARQEEPLPRCRPGPGRVGAPHAWLRTWRQAAARPPFAQGRQHPRPRLLRPQVRQGALGLQHHLQREHRSGRSAHRTIQMANLAAIFANKGWYYDPHVVRAVGEADSLQAKYREKHVVEAAPHWFDHIQEGMRRVVNEPGGTAKNARLKDITVCGKTGTAENPHGQDHAVFVCFAPMEDPQIAMAVYVENSGFGGTWAAPIASLLIEQYLTDTITRPDVMQRMLDADLIAQEKFFRKKPKKPRRR